MFNIARFLFGHTLVARTRGTRSQHTSIFFWLQQKKLVYSLWGTRQDIVGKILICNM